MEFERGFACGAELEREKSAGSDDTKGEPFISAHSNGGMTVVNLQKTISNINDGFSSIDKERRDEVTWKAETFREAL